MQCRKHGGEVVNDVVDVVNEVHVDSGYSTRLNIYVPFHLVFVSLDEREM